jgi:hypothetical protein
MRAAPWLCLLAALAACHPSADNSVRPGAAHRATAAAGSPEQRALDVAHHMGPGVPVGGGTAAVEVRFELASAPVPGQPFEVRLAVLPDAVAAQMQVEVTAGDGLVLSAPSAPLTVQKVEPGTVQFLTAEASAERPGTHVLTVRVTFDNPGGSETRDFSFPVVVGARPPVPAG